VSGTQKHSCEFGPFSALHCSAAAAVSGLLLRRHPWSAKWRFQARPRPRAGAAIGGCGLPRPGSARRAPCAGARLLPRGRARRRSDRCREKARIDKLKGRDRQAAFAGDDRPAQKRLRHPRGDRHRVCAELAARSVARDSLELGAPKANPCHGRFTMGRARTAHRVIRCFQRLLKFCPARTDRILNPVGRKTR